MRGDHLTIISLQAQNYVLPAQQDKKRSKKRKIEKIVHACQSNSGVPAVGAAVLDENTSWFSHVWCAFLNHFL
jgi:mannitol-specific phosphotransferase system IIBC component